MLRLLAALRNIVEGVLLCANSLGFFQRSPQHIGHVSIGSIIDDQVKDLFVANDIKGTHKDDQRDVLLNHRDGAHDCLATAALL